MNPVSKVLVVVQDGTLAEAGRVFVGHTVVEESNFLPNDVRRAVSTSSPDGRQGWVLQQVIGLWASVNSTAPGNLVLDSDTIFLRPISFLDNAGHQLLQFSHEYVAEYERHACRIWGERRRHHNLSYVTHYQLMQPDIVREMFPGPNSLANWVSSLDKSKKSPLADYHSYGRFLADKHPSRYVLGRWGNKTMTWGLAKELLYNPSEQRSLRGFESYYSLSVHTYMDKAKGVEPN